MFSLKAFADPHRDPHGKMSGRKQWNKQAATSSFLDKKPLESLILQGLEGSTTLRNQQVMCSSHTTSSKKHRKLRFSMLFCCKNAENGVCQNAGQLLTHTVTHIGWQSAALPPTASSCPMGTRKCTERVKEHRSGSYFPLRCSVLYEGFYRTCAMKFPIFSAAFCCICRVTWV